MKLVCYQCKNEFEFNGKWKQAHCKKCGRCITVSKALRIQSGLPLPTKKRVPKPVLKNYFFCFDQLTDEEYDKIRRIAAEEGKTPEAWMQQVLAEIVRLYDK